MQKPQEKFNVSPDPYKPVADKLFSYLHDVIYKPDAASLDVEDLPEAFSDFGKGLLYFCSLVSETKAFAKELAIGNLNCTPPPPANEIASSLKRLHSSLKHLSWQTQQVAKGDYNQRVNFMGDFSAAFNNMVEQLERKRKITLDEKTKLEMYVHLILFNCPYPILLFDSQEELAYISDSYFRYCKTFNIEEVHGKKIYELFAPLVSEQALEEIGRLYKSAIAEERMFKTQQEIHFGDNDSSMYFEIQITPMLDTDGSVAGIIVFLFDMTENIQARREAENARELAEQASRAKSDFLAKMSHEIRTPMNAILGMAELALRENVSPAAGKHIHTIRQAGVNLLSIINDILDFSKIEAGKLKIVPVEYQLSSLINDVVSIIRMRLIQKPVRFFTNIDSHIPANLIGDEVRMRQILLNLLSNAAKYTERGHISITITQEKRTEEQVWLKIVVADTGQGIKPEDQSKLFRDFSQVVTLKRGIEGTGLGLVITRQLCIAMGADITMESEFGKGSAFTVNIPQGIKSLEPFAHVKDPAKNNILIYEPRQVDTRSIAWSLENMKIPHTVVNDHNDFIQALGQQGWSLVFSGYGLYSKIKPVFDNLPENKRPPLALMLEWGNEAYIPNVRFISLPVQTLSIANTLNGKADIYAYFGNDTKQSMFGFSIPGARILLVDDIATNLKVAEGLLIPYQAEIETCLNGKEAVELVKQRNYDLVLMDHMMPEMDGIEATAAIRAWEKEKQALQQLPIVALTANVVSGAKEMFIKNGFSDFLAKPIVVSKLEAILDRWIPGEKRGPGIDISENSAIANTPPVPEIPGIDTEKGLLNTGGKPDGYRQVLSIFHKDAEDRLSLLKVMPDSDNLPLFITHVHALKSASASIGAEEVSKMAMQLENAGKSGSFDFIEKNLSGFTERLEELVKNIRTALKDKETKEAEIPPSFSVSLASSLLALVSALESQDASEIDRIVDELMENPMDSKTKQVLETIADEILMAEFESAANIINKLLQGINIKTEKLISPQKS